MTLTASDTASWTTKHGAAVRTGSRDIGIDSMRGAAILMVIGIHALPHPLTPAWETLLDSALRPCVPIFLFASGYLSSHAQHIPLARRMKATLIPYIIAFAAAYLYMALHNPGMDHRLQATLVRFGLAYVFVYYYVFVYAGCTALLWLVFRLAPPDQDNALALTILLTIAIGFGLVAGAYLDPLMEKLDASPSLIEEARMRNIPFWFAFVALGLLIGLADGRGALHKTRVILAVAASMAFAIYAAVRLWQIGDHADYDSVAFFTYSAIACLLLLGSNVSFPFLAEVGSGSYFIYLWHIFILMALRDHGAFQRFGAVADFILTFVTVTVGIITALLAIRRLAPPTVVRWLGA